MFPSREGNECGVGDNGFINYDDVRDGSPTPVPFAKWKSRNGGEAEVRGVSRVRVFLVCCSNASASFRRVCGRVGWVEQHLFVCSSQRAFIFPLENRRKARRIRAVDSLVATLNPRSASAPKTCIGLRNKRYSGEPTQTVYVYDTKPKHENNERGRTIGVELGFSRQPQSLQREI